ncbi:MAG TPA: SLBB domain-containing protein, partial [Cyclobacteriaceae bacterium]|nr:SLBB domain-containing protein [Cyclobacteriaceae bacterium]
MVGELEKPGTYSLPSFATVFNSLYAAGGPTTNGTFRSIQVYRANRLAAEVDVYEFLVSGRSGQNIRLEDNDVVIVKPAERKVEVIGEVRRPGIFEMKADETFEQLLKYTGGFSARAYKDRVVVKRASDTRLRIDDISKEEYSTFVPRDGDEFRIAELLNLYENRVQVSGAVQRPGEYQFTEGLTIKGLLEKAGGIMGDAFANRAVIYRTNPDFSLAVLPVSLKDVLSGEVNDLALQSEDVLSIPSIYDLREEYFVHINGEVNRPGVYSFAQGMTVADLVTKAGGFKESASGSFIEIARRAENVETRKIADIIRLEISRDLTVTESNQRQTLQPFDQVFIRRRPGFQPTQLAEAQGELNYPGQYALSHATMRISDLVKRAGGLSVEAYVQGATLIRRTEFYKEKTEQQQREELLRNLMAALEKRDELTEAEQQQLSRLDK